MKEFYSIGEVAAKLDVSIDKLRRWEKIFPHILKPIRRNNWRYYREDDLPILREIKFLLKIGVPPIGIQRMSRKGLAILSRTSTPTN
jgi:DNA-binding transcriptional MerR regulator